MTTHASALKYGIVPVQGEGLLSATVSRMLDADDGTGRLSRSLMPGEPLPLGALAVLVADTTVYGTLRVEQLLRQWDPRVPRPWLVWVADAPARPAPAARFRIRALQARLAGVSQLPYLGVLRMVETPDEAMADKDVQSAAATLRRAIERNG
ncbi:hypothetical protein [Streptomyces sp. NPDC088360]|uniref:hypothetical protein n=1 Tax=Streptomyces sp. NPDC088360 TaxID=3154515 RepID=UPI00344E5E08